MFVTTLLAVSLAAPVPKAKAPELYFPTVEGTKRVMQAKSGDQTTETTETVTKVAERNGTHTVTVSREVGKSTYEVWYSVSAKGVSELGQHRVAWVTPLLKLPANEGDTWTFERQIGGPAKITYTVGKEEEVEVPAGKFKAIPITEESGNGRNAQSGITWYAPGVGVVKVVSKTNGTERVSELKEFTPGKAK